MAVRTKERVDLCGCRSKEAGSTGSGEKSRPQKKHPCPDCTFCQWCGDDRCSLCLRKTDCRSKKLSMEQQIALFDELNRKNADARSK